MLPNELWVNVNQLNVGQKRQYKEAADTFNYLRSKGKIDPEAHYNFIMKRNALHIFIWKDTKEGAKQLEDTLASDFISSVTRGEIREYFKND